MPVNKHPYQVVESLRNHDFARLKDWDEEKFFSQERCDIITYIYRVHTKLKQPEPTRYLEILEGYLQVRTNPNKNSNSETNNQSMVCKSRSDRLNKLATINQSSNYLEIGVSKGVTFNAINIKKKVAVDPKFRFKTNKYATENIVFLEITSDEFFRHHAKGFPPFDLIYLDGLHTFEQTFRDFCASISLAHHKTIWLIDDTYPGSYAQAQSSLQHCAKLKRISQEKGGGWMGDVFKVVAAIHDFFPQFSFATFPDHGQTVVWNQWRGDFEPLWNSLETISRLEYLDFVELQGTLFKRQPYEEIFQSIKLALST
ncbi:MAG: class I SAM-dependent methyltransferase [Microcoleaceae cyanobacterium MO_207.B10]|nr:class I SAM-dependent methyltransferase [Microcoleaceae cyanobacterium MO_207.B10]